MGGGGGGGGGASPRQPTAFSLSRVGMNGYRLLIFYNIGNPGPGLGQTHNVAVLSRLAFLTTTR